MVRTRLRHTLEVYDLNVAGRGATEEGEHLRVVRLQANRTRVHHLDWERRWTSL